jgi:hypothetical protein
MQQFHQPFGGAGGAQQIAPDLGEHRRRSPIEDHHRIQHRLRQRGPGAHAAVDHRLRAAGTGPTAAMAEHAGDDEAHGQHGAQHRACGSPSGGEGCVRLLRLKSARFARFPAREGSAPPESALSTSPAMPLVSAMRSWLARDTSLRTRLGRSYRLSSTTSGEQAQHLRSSHRHGLVTIKRDHQAPDEHAPSCAAPC